MPPEWEDTFGRPITSIGEINLLEQRHYAADWDVLRPAKEGMARAVAKPVKMGRQLCIYSVEVFDESDANGLILKKGAIKVDRLGHRYGRESGAGGVNDVSFNIDPG